jgi:hypothetical protein
VLILGQNDLMYLIWPSSIMLVRGWRSTFPGIIITVSSVVINCITYIAIAVLLRAFIRLITKTRILGSKSGGTLS